MVLQWGHVERALNVALFMSRDLRSPDAHRGRAPLAFKRKVRAIEAVLRNGRLFDGDWGNFPEYPLTLARNVAAQRHDIIHGLEIGFTAGPPPRIRFLHQTLEPCNIKERIVSFTIEKIETLIDQRQELHLLLSGLCFASM